MNALKEGEARCSDWVLSRKGNVVGEYQGARSGDAIAAYVEALLRPALSVLKTAEDVTAFTKDGIAVLANVEGVSV